MGVFIMFIVNKQLPKSCYDCMLTYMSYENDDDEFCVFWEVKDSIQHYEDERHPNCPLVELTKEQEEQIKEILS